MRSLIAVFLLAGAAAGAVGRFAGGAAPAARAATALFVAFGLLACLGAAFRGAATNRIRHGGIVFAAAFVASWIAATVAGDAAALGACAVVAGAASLASGAASLLAARGAGPGRAAFAGAALPAGLVALAFVADPFVEWRGSSTEEAPARAAAVISASPLAAMASDTGVDWQRSRWMYDGPAPGEFGLSVIGRYYPSRPSSPWALGLAGAAAGIAMLALARPKPAVG